MDKDITNEVEFNLNDDECLPLTKCACGLEFEAWNFIVGVYRDSPAICPECGRKMYFKAGIKVYEVEEKKEEGK